MKWIKTGAAFLLGVLLSTLSESGNAQAESVAIPANVNAGAVQSWDLYNLRREREERQIQDYIRSPESREPEIRYKTRDGQYTDQTGFIRDTLQRTEQNLP